MAEFLKTRIDPFLYHSSVVPCWSFLERKTRIQREYLASSFVVLVLLYLAYGSRNDFLCNFIGFVYPAYISLLATNSPTYFDTTKWRIYWLVYTGLILIEYGRCFFTISIPFYWLGKCLFLLWLMTSTRTGFLYEKIIAALTLLVRSLNGKKKELYLTCNPPDKNIKVQLRDGHSKVNQWLQCDEYGRIPLDALADGKYQVEVYANGTAPLLLLHTFMLNMVNGIPDIAAVDVQGTTLHLTIKRSDQPLQRARVQGKFYGPNKQAFDLTGQTNEEGVITFVLPQGSVSNLIAATDQTEVKHMGNVTIASPVATPVHVPRPVKYIIIDVNSSSFSSSINPMNKNARVVILGDISGSMGSGNKMDVLRRSFQEIFDKCQKHGWQVSLASWDTEIEWCTGNGWIASSQTTTVQTWIKSQHARGGNDMKTAIECCMGRHPDATDVYVMCDGDITPFVLTQGEPNWTRFRNQYPSTTFHFIALGTGASVEPMEAMASIGGGSFTHNV